LEYKAKWYGSNVVVIDRFYPSSNFAVIANIQPMPLHFSMTAIGLSDRDLNAALNIRNYSETASSAVEACGWDLPGKPDEAEK